MKLGRIHLVLTIEWRRWPMMVAMVVLVTQVDGTLKIATVHCGC